MKFKMRRNKQGVSICFRAETDDEGVDLKDALLASHGCDPTRVIDGLKERGYSGAVVARGRYSLVATLEKPGSEKPLDSASAVV